LIRRLRNDKGSSSVGVIYSEKTREEVAYCDRCLKMANVRSKLGNRIYFPDSSGNIVIPPDDDKWRQCHRCGKIYGTYEVKQEAEISPFAEDIISDNPFDFGNGRIHGVDNSRKFDRTGRTQRKKRFKQDLSQYKEQDIKDALRKGAKLVSYEEKMPT
jgi:hypothetical protein